MTGLIQDTDKRQAVVNTVMNLPSTHSTLSVYWEQFGFFLLQQVSALYGHHQVDKTELTEKITKFLHFNVCTVIHSCYTSFELR